jgi:hypothetical protein
VPIRDAPAGEGCVMTMRDDATFLHVDLDAFFA